MPLPYENSSTGQSAIGEIQKVLTSFGCQGFGHYIDVSKGVVLVQFRHHDQEVQVKASYKGYAAAWLRHNPYTTRMRCKQIDHERRALKQAEISVWSILRDWIKGQVTAIETGMLSFEGAFLGQILLPSTGKTVLETAIDQKLIPRITQE